MNKNIFLTLPVRPLARCLFCLLLTILSACLGCAVKEGPLFKKDGKIYGKTEGVFKEKWNDYYLRGLSYAEGGYWDHAAADFHRALEKRGQDQRRARTYGIHLIDYFPNRELGIAYYQMGRFEDAIHYLETSLSSTRSARAEFYLNRSRRQWLNQNQLDRLPPTIAVTFPPAVYTTNQLQLCLQGKAFDDFYVAGVTVNSDKIEPATAQKQISFSRDIRLIPGQNNITIKALDLTGKACTPLSLSVYVDTTGPLVLLDSVVKSDGSVEVSGSAFDNRSVSSVEIAGHLLQINPNRFIKFRTTLDSTIFNKSPQASFTVSDTAGNQTCGVIDISKDSSYFDDRTFPRLAFALQDEQFPAMRLSRILKHASNPLSTQNSITIKEVSDNQTVYTDSFYLEGNATAPFGIRDLRVGDRSLFSTEGDSAASLFLNELLTSKKKTLAFSCLIPLTEGQNNIQVSLTDRTGHRTSRNLCLIRKIPLARRLSSRLTLSVYPFSLHNDREDTIQEYVHSRLVHAFVNQQRFQVLERKALDRILHEQQMSQESVFDPQTALQLGRLMASETILVGDVFVKKGSLEIIARLIDTETALVIAEKDAYWEQESPPILAEVLQGLALKFKQHLPIREGEILSSKNESVVFNLGQKDSICIGMRFLAFKETTPVRELSDGRLIGTHTQLLGLVSASEIQTEFSVGQVLKTFTADHLKSGHQIISK